MLVLALVLVLDEQMYRIEDDDEDDFGCVEDATALIRRSRPAPPLHPKDRTLEDASTPMFEAPLHQAQPMVRRNDEPTALTSGLLVDRRQLPLKDIGEGAGDITEPESTGVRIAVEDGKTNDAALIRCEGGDQIGQRGRLVPVQLHIGDGSGRKFVAWIDVLRETEKRVYGRNRERLYIEAGPAL